jgi:small-conductance mechanosensitive channel
MKEFLYKVYWNNRLLDYLILAAGILLLWVILRLLKVLLLRRLKRLVAITKTQIDDALVKALDRYIVPLAYLTINFLLIRRLNFPVKYNSWIDHFIALIWIFFLVRIVNHTIEQSIKIYMYERGESVERIRQVSGIITLIKCFIWVLGILLMLSNLGINVTAALTSVGISGIIIALATQNIFADLFSYFVIYFDKPFEVGDAINVNGRSGTVEKIGFKSSQIRSLSGEQLVMPNAELVKSAIQNYKRQERRRVAFNIRVAQNTDEQFLREFPQMVKDIVATYDHTQMDRAHLANIREVSIEFEIVYFINSPDYGLFMDTQQDVYLKIISILRQRDISFAEPSSNILINNQLAGPQSDIVKQG